MSYDDVANEFVRLTFQAAKEAADAEGDEWLENAMPKFRVFQTDIFGTRISPPEQDSFLLDVCGGAYLQVKDKRSKAYRLLKKAGVICKYGEERTVDVQYKHRSRQERGLHIVCCQAFWAVLRESGFDGIILKSYID